jgi:hypothetical protein
MRHKCQIRARPLRHVPGLLTSLLAVSSGQTGVLFNGLARLVEEVYRDEPQTKVFGAFAFTSGLQRDPSPGAILKTLPSPTAGAHALSPRPLRVRRCVGRAAMGVDFPESDRRFARLT